MLTPKKSFASASKASLKTLKKSRKKLETTSHATPRQRLAVKTLLEEGGSVRRAMLKAGYTPTMAKNPKKLTETKGFKELMEEVGITDLKLAEVLNSGLNATRVISAVGGKEANGATTDFIEVPDYAVRHKYLETGLKLKGHQQENNLPNVIQIIKEQKNKYGI